MLKIFLFNNEFINFDQLIEMFKDFEELYPEMAKKIEECSFCSIDCELSGVTQYKDLNSFDTPKNRYDRMKKVSNLDVYLVFFLKRLMLIFYHWPFT